MFSTVWCLNRVKIVSPEVLRLGFFEVVVNTLCTRRVGTLNFKMKVTYELLALQLDPNRRDGEGRWRMNGGVEARQRGRGRKGRKEGVWLGGGREGRAFERGAAFAPYGSSLTSKRYKSGQKYNEHLDGHNNIRNWIYIFTTRLILG